MRSDSVKLEVVIIAAVSENNVIGKNNNIPWHIKEDLMRFKKKTLNNYVIMGRKTYGSIINKLGKPLPNRKNIVLTRNSDLKVANGVTTFNNLEDALNYCSQNTQKKVYIIGGSEVYKSAMPYATILEITKFHENFKGDSYFPHIDPKIWFIKYSQPKIPNQNNESNKNFSYTFETYYKR